MNLEEYFETHTGDGVLATADGQGRVNGALYARPHVMDGRTVAFIMGDRLSHANLMQNPCAAYIFIPKGPRREGLRLYLTMARQEEDSPLVPELRRRGGPAGEARDPSQKKFLVYFTVDKVLPLVGASVPVAQ